jgi:carbamoyl-phosphate synthase large subunit
MSRSVLALAVVGGLLVVLGIGWRIITTRQIHHRLISLLGSADPATRAGTMAIVAAEGIEGFASKLLRMSKTETDPTVLAALAAVVNRTQAMPARSPDLISLRLWAAARDTGGSAGAVAARRAAASAVRLKPVPNARAMFDERRLMNGNSGRYPTPTLSAAQMNGNAGRHPTPTLSAAQMNGNAGRHPTPTLSAAQMNGNAGRHPTPALSAAQGREAAWATIQPQSSIPAGAASGPGRVTEHLGEVREQPFGGHAQSAPRRNGEDGRRPTRPVLVTGAGGPAGVAVIRALRRVGHRVVAADADSWAVGFRLADEWARVPRADDPAFAESLLKVAARSGAVALIPTVAEELRPLHAAARQLGDAGLATWLPHPWSVEHCVDKWLFYQLMIEYGVPVPATSRSSERGIPGPWIVKPRFGRGSRDVYEVNDTTGMAYAFGRVPEPLVQTKITGREFTVDTLSGDDGRLYGAVPRWRVETKAGISTKGLTFESPELVDKLAKLLGVLRLVGPACAQGFLTDQGELVFIEVNPRFSGGLPLSLAAGADLVGQYLNRILGGAMDPARLRFRPGMAMLRYFDEVFEE